MIFIDLLGNPPPKELIEEGKRLTEELKRLTPDKRDQFIDNHAQYWGKLKTYYSELSNGKCWYTEARDVASYYHMDHFRPKKSVRELKRDCSIRTINNKDSYWWLAFDWKNYRFSASIPNTSKGSYFPLQPGTQIATDEDSLQYEWPGLLDPTDEYDVALIAFDDAGKVCPACSDDSTWDATRVKLSVRVYDLDNVALVEARKQVQQTCKRRIDRIIKIQHSYSETKSPEFRDELRERVKELKEMTKPTAELSAVARNYIRNYPEEFIRNIAS